MIPKVYDFINEGFIYFPGSCWIYKRDPEDREEGRPHHMDRTCLGQRDEDVN